MRREFDVLIVGASVAGSSLAIRLGRAGVSTALIDAQVFPRRKACGEGLSGLGVEHLKELGIFEKLLAPKAHAFHGYTIQRGLRQSQLRFSTTADHAQVSLGIARSELDSALLDAASSYSSVETMTGIKVRSAETSKDRVRITLGNTPIYGKFLVLADGARSFLAPRLGIAERKISSKSRLAMSAVLKGHYAELPDTVQVFIKDGLQVCCTPTAEDTLNISMLTEKNRIGADIQDTFQELLTEIKDSIGFKGELIDTPIGVSGIGKVRRTAYRQRVLLVGDAVEQLDPIGGMGMTHALVSSKLAAASLIEATAQEDRYATCFEQYAGARERVVRPLRGFTRLSYFSLVGLRPRYADLASLIEQSAISNILSRAVHGMYAPRCLENQIASLFLTSIGVCL